MPLDPGSDHEQHVSSLMVEALRASLAEGLHAAVDHWVDDLVADQLVALTVPLAAPVTLDVMVIRD